MKYNHFEINFKGVLFNIKLLDSSALFPNSLNTDKNRHEEFKVIVTNGNNEIEFKFYNSEMERAMSEYLNNLGYVNYNNPVFKSFVKSRFHWGGYDEVKNRNDLEEKRIINLFYSVISDIALNINEDLSSFSWFCGNFGYDEDSRTAENIYKSCQVLQEKLLRLNLNKDFLKYLNEEAMQETDKFEEDIIKAVQESKLIN